MKKSFVIGLSAVAALAATLLQCLKMRYDLGQAVTSIPIQEIESNEIRDIVGAISESPDCFGDGRATWVVFRTSSQRLLDLASREQVETWLYDPEFEGDVTYVNTNGIELVRKEHVSPVLPAQSQIFWKVYLPDIDRRLYYEVVFSEFGQRGRKSRVRVVLVPDRDDSGSGIAIGWLQ